jgi:hypothetical protein
MLEASETTNPNLIQVPHKSKRWLQIEAEEREHYRIMRMNRLVNEKINDTLETAQRVVQECKQQILDLVSFLGEDQYPKMHDLRVKMVGYTEQEKEDFESLKARKIEDERADFSRRRAEIRAYKWQDEVERLEAFKDLSIFESGGVDYIHPPAKKEPFGKYQPRN